MSVFELFVSTSSVNASKFEFFFCPVTAKEAINELSTVSAASKETINELSVPYTFLGPYVHYLFPMFQFLRGLSLRFPYLSAAPW